MGTKPVIQSLHVISLAFALSFLLIENISGSGTTTTTMTTIPLPTNLASRTSTIKTTITALISSMITTARISTPTTNSTSDVTRTSTTQSTSVKASFSTLTPTLRSSTPTIQPTSVTARSSTLSSILRSSTTTPQPTNVTTSSPTLTSTLESSTTTIQPTSDTCSSTLIPTLRSSTPTIQPTSVETSTSATPTTDKANSEDKTKTLIIALVVAVVCVAVAVGVLCFVRRRHNARIKRRSEEFINLPNVNRPPSQGESQNRERTANSYVSFYDVSLEGVANDEHKYLSLNEVKRGDTTGDNIYSLAGNAQRKIWPAQVQNANPALAERGRLEGGAIEKMTESAENIYSLASETGQISDDISPQYLFLEKQKRK